jgi:integrase/recombinase XerD
MEVHARWTLDALVASFIQHQQRARGTCAHTLRAQERVVRQFVRAALGDDPIDPAQLRASDVIAFISANAARFRPCTVKGMATSLRWFFRFLRFARICDGRLDEIVPTVAEWRLATIPRGLDERDLGRLLASLAGSTACARRDRAIIQLLASLGLRAGELAALQLEDIDWRAGTVHIRTRKTGRGAVLPLPRAAGQAIVAYLRRGRPATADRHVFTVHQQGRLGIGISGSRVAAVVRCALLRAGIKAPAYGAHVLRHALATRMIRRGARLEEIADVLGHRSLDTTAIYAKVDLPALRDVALPWPEVQP